MWLSEGLSVAEAAGVLGVSDVRVHKMLRDGILPDRHVGRAWVVPTEAVAGLAARQVGAGRPLAPLRAWALLDMLDGGKAPWVAPVARSQVRAEMRRLEGADASVWRAALRSRESRLAVSRHRSAIDRLAEADDVWPAGPATARESGADLVVAGAVPEFYLPAERWPALERKLRLGPTAGRPSAYVRIPRRRWPFGSAGSGRAGGQPLDGDDWRAARAGVDVLNERAREFLG